jgi:hypothetical protein
MTPSEEAPITKERVIMDKTMRFLESEGVPHFGTRKEAVDDLSAAGGNWDLYEDASTCGFKITYKNLISNHEMLGVGGISIIHHCYGRCSQIERDRLVAVKKFLFRHSDVCVGCIEETSALIFRKTGVPFLAESRELLYRELPMGGAGMEIGVCTGANASELLKSTSPASLVLVDPWNYKWHAFNLEKSVFGGVNGNLPPEEAAEAVFRHASRLVGSDPRVTIMRGTAAEKVPQIPDGSLDWAYIDGDHSYLGALTDLELVLPKMKPACVIAGHDWCYPSFHGVVNAVEKFLADNKDFRFVGLSKDRYSKTFMLRRG